MSTLVILPLAIRLEYETKNVRYQTAATHILYEELAAAVKDIQAPARVVERDGYSFEVIYPDEHRICVKYIDSYKKWNEQCGLLE